jgi:hypothetical protein
MLIFALKLIHIYASRDSRESNGAVLYHVCTYEVCPSIQHLTVDFCRTMFFKDPSANCLEFKAMTNPENLFAKYTVHDPVN